MLRLAGFRRDTRTRDENTTHRLLDRLVYRERRGIICPVLVAMRSFIGNPLQILQPESSITDPR
jgi:hypothetical protein